MKIRLLFTTLCAALFFNSSNAADLEKDFINPPDDARPGVYWYFMDGNLNRDEMVKDLESMKEVGIGNLVFLEVGIGVPRGPVEFMSDEWQDLYVNAVRHAERLGIDITLGAGPGWTGSGGPWVPAEDSMQHLVFSTVDATGPRKFDAILPVPEQRSTNWHKMSHPFYEDSMVYAFPASNPVIERINEKALYERDPYTSYANMHGTKEFFLPPTSYPKGDSKNLINPETIIDLTDKLDSKGRLTWDVPEGEWTILRMGRRSTGASTRPAPEPGIGFDHDKFDKKALEDHFDNYYGKLLDKVGDRADKHGWTTVHMDSWEMGSQNWTPRFREEFGKRRGYDPHPYFITFSGRAVTSVEVTERFLWDMRLTAQELVLENYAGHLKTLGAEHGFELSIEPYDMNPTADLDLGAVADVPMCEFWGAGFGFDSSFTCIEATSIAHTMGKSIVSAEAFTGQDQWQQYPWSMKNQGDWAFAIGINRFVYHTFAHKPLGEEHRPGMTMGPYGVHWDRGQTWWPMVSDYHGYVTRCSNMMRQGVTVSDVLYLTPEGAPHVFQPPKTALQGEAPMPDKKGYAFDGCSPNILIDRAEVKAGKIVFPGGTSYRLMVLPRFETMTPKLLEKIIELVNDGATVYGAPPKASPSLSGYPHCDARIQELAQQLWGTAPTPERKIGKGRIILDQHEQPGIDNEDNMSLLPDAGQWIWFNEGEPASSAPVDDVHLRYSWEITDISAIEKASIEATADNEFKLKINNTEVLTGDNFNTIYSADILSELRDGKNQIYAIASNGGDSPNPAGFIAAMRLRFKDGTSKVMGTDKHWTASISVRKKSAAKVLGVGNMAPWHLLAQSKAQLPELYPEYDVTAAVLKAMDIPEDFVSDGPIRYGHRRTETQEIYFIANTTNEKVEATCTFRVTQGAPELWDPVTAEIRTLPQFTRQGQTTSIPMRFEAHQSFFVLFPINGTSTTTTVAGLNFQEATPKITLEGSWDVSFDPTWGGPKQVTFDTLQDWTTFEDSGIKYYSGMATYSKTFNLTEKSDKRTYLDLGTVHDIARVRLNGKDLGVVWCAPWRIEITDALVEGMNDLEIEVANRWPNRLLGDQQPPDKNIREMKWDSGFLEGRSFKTGRYTFATRSGPGKLLPSGLIGPVQLKMIP